MSRSMMVRIVVCTLILAGAWFPAYAATTASSSAEVVTIAILPFTMHTPSELEYLQGGIRSMLGSRLAWEGKVIVVDQGTIDQAVGSTKNMTKEKAVQVGAKVAADYAIYGSITALGQSISIDANMIPLKGTSQPVSLSTQTNTMDDVIPQINRFAQDINAKVFNRAAPSYQDASSAGASNRNPEYLVSGMKPQEGSISYLNPNFVEVTPQGSLRQPGIWHSQTFGEGIIGMDIGDLNGDGTTELVILSTTKLTVLQRQAQGLRTLGVYKATTLDQFVWVAMADLNGDKKDEIVITNLRKQNRPGNYNPEATVGGTDSVERLASIVLTLTGNKLKVLSQDQPFFLNTVHLGKRGRILIGQRKGLHGDLFEPDLFEMNLRGNQLAPGASVPVPSHCNVFNFAKVDLDNDQSDEIVLISTDNRLRILSSTGDQRWKSRKRFGATSNYILGKVEDLRYNAVEYFYLPSPILVTDLNQDGIAEVIVNRSPDYSNLTPVGLKYYEAGEIVSLSWNQLGLVENWKSRELSGMVTSMHLGSLVRDKKTQLIVSLVAGTDLAQFWKAKSSIISYDLAVAPAPKAAPTGQ